MLQISLDLKGTFWDRYSQSSRAESQNWRKSRENRTCRHYIIFSMISSVCLTLCYLDLLHKSDSQIDWGAIIENSVPTSQLHNFSGKFTFERLIPHRTTTGNHLIVEWSQVDLNSNPLHILLVTATQISLFSNVNGKAKGLARIGKGRLHNHVP